MNALELSSRLEHTILRPDLLPAEAHKAATGAMQGGLAGVVVAPVWVKRMATMLNGSGVRITAAVGYPNGTNKGTVKAIEATSCIKDGASELWVTPFLPNLIRADLDSIKLELLEITRAARSTRRDVRLHALIDWPILARKASLAVEEATGVACQAVRESGFDGIVIAAGPATTDRATIQVVRNLRKAGQELTLTAFGMFDGKAAVEQLLETGADRAAAENAAEMFAAMTG